MIPYFDFSTFHLGPLTIHTWGFVVSIGIAVAIFVAYKRGQSLALMTKLSFNYHAILDLAFWIIVFAFLGARLFHVAFYEGAYYSQHLREIIRIDQGGLSSFGGFIGAAVAFFWYTRRHKMKSWQYADVLMFAWPLGQGIGRLGCFLTHMHPGRLTDAWFAVQYPGGARLDMGLIESSVLLLYGFIVILFWSRHKLADGFYLISGMIFYGVARFVLDFFRAVDLPMSDTRYLGLTPAQYGSILLLASGIFLAHKFAIRRLA